MFENHRKSLIQNCELHFEWTKVHQRSQKWSTLFKLAVEQCYQTGQFEWDKNWWKIKKIQKFKCDILGDFQTLWIRDYDDALLYDDF